MWRSRWRCLRTPLCCCKKLKRSGCDRSLRCVPHRAQARQHLPAQFRTPTSSDGSPVPASVLAAPIAGLCALGVVVLGIGIYRLRYRATPSRRVAALLAQDRRSASSEAPLQAAVATPPRWLLELRQVLAQIEARDSTL